MGHAPNPTIPTPHTPPPRYYINQRRATFYADTFESETKSMKHARLLFTSWDVSITEEKEMDDMKTSTTTASNLRVTATSLTAPLTTYCPYYRSTTSATG